MTAAIGPRPSVSTRLAQIDEQTFLENVNVSMMFTAPYCRSVSAGQIGRMMSAGWDVRKAGIVTLSMRPDGRFAIVDGNHRRHLANALGIMQLVARVFIDLTYEEEAELFEALNTIKPPSALDRFKSRLERKERIALDMTARISAFGVRFASGNARERKGVIGAVNAWENLYANLGPERFTDVARVVYKAWEHDPTAWTGKIVDGLHAFYARYSDSVNEEDLIAKLQRVLPSRLLAEAGAISTGGGEKHGTLVGKRIVALYNARRRKNLLPQWQERVSAAATSNKQTVFNRGKRLLTRTQTARGQR